MWGGGDGSADAQAGGVQGQTADAPPVGAGAGAAGGAAMSEDEQIYGRQPGQADAAPPGGVDGQTWADEGMDRPDQPRYGQEEVMLDPWTDEKSSGWFGGEDSGDSGSDWGDWGGGDWS